MLKVFAIVFLSKEISFSISKPMFDDPFNVLEIPKFLKAFQRSVEEFLHYSILSLKYVRFADFLIAVIYFLKDNKFWNFLQLFVS